MRKIEITVYSFDELNERAKRKVINDFGDINVNYEWWESTYDDASRIALTLDGFELERYVSGEFKEDAMTTANKIKAEHGDTCETYKTAVEFIANWDNLVEKHSDGVDKNKVSEENEYQFDKEADELEKEFLKSLLEDYRIILQKEYDYLTSVEQITESIKANGYEFDKNGRQV